MYASTAAPAARMAMGVPTRTHRGSRLRLADWGARDSVTSSAVGLGPVTPFDSMDMGNDSLFLANGQDEIVDALDRSVMNQAVMFSPQSAAHEVSGPPEAACAGELPGFSGSSIRRRQSRRFGQRMPRRQFPR